jgi:hypothetical protein
VKCDEDSWKGELIPKRKGRWQGIGWLWSTDFGVGVEHVDVLCYFCLLIRGSFTAVILKISA